MTKKSLTRLQGQGDTCVQNRHAPLTSNQSQLVQAIGKDEPRIDTRVLAEHLGSKHHSVFALVKKYQDDFQTFGKVRFQIEPLANSKTGQKERFALLNEDQSYLLLTYSRNSKRVRPLKVKLVKAFSEARKAASQHDTEYLPTYHALHDQIKEVGGGRFQHINFNRAINHAVGIEPETRSQVAVPIKSAVVVAQMMAVQSISQSDGDLKHAYKDLKEQLGVLTKALPSNSHAHENNLLEGA